MFLSLCGGNCNTLSYAPDVQRLENTPLFIILRASISQQYENTNITTTTTTIKKQRDTGTCWRPFFFFKSFSFKTSLMPFKTYLYICMQSACKNGFGYFFHLFFTGVYVTYTVHVHYFNKKTFPGHSYTSVKSIFAPRCIVGTCNSHRYIQGIKIYISL
ncbi:hypothetical protein DFH27DRAFT_356735 [Peziza echinospora]|nr:hypothetical protein DFH27DRAFT_356735 [Peziza echinospora]